MFRSQRGRADARPRQFHWSILLLEAIIGIAVVLNLVRACGRTRQVRGEMNTLRAQIEQTNAQAASLQELIAYVNSSAYVEEKARRDLGMQQAGEHLVIIDDQALGQQATSTATLQAAPPWQKWVRLFFDK